MIKFTYHMKNITFPFSIAYNITRIYNYKALVNA